MRNDGLAVAAVAVSSGVLATFAGLSPTGTSSVDIALVVVSVGMVTWIAAAASPLVVGGAALAAGALSGSPWLAAVGVGAFGMALWIRDGQRWSQRLSATLALVALNVAARGSLDWFLGAETLVAVMVGLTLLIGGLTQRRARTRWIIAGAAVTYAAAAIVGTATMALAGARAADDLRAAERAVDSAMDFVISGDPGSARRSLESAIASLASFQSSMDNPLARSVVVVPVAAQHRQATLEVSRNASAAMTSISAELDAFDLDAIMAGPGTVDLDAVRALERPMLDFREALSEVSASVASSRSPWLVDRVSNRLDDLGLIVDEQVQRADVALEVIRAMPGLLGADQRRTYFLAFTTPSEVRGLNGFMGLYAELTADDGRITMTNFSRKDALERALESSDETSVIDGPGEWLDRYSRFGFAGPSSPPGTPLGTWGNITLSPDSAATGEVISQLYPHSGGTTVDGVFAIDVIAVSRLLDITGPVVTSEDFTLDADNAEAFLLNGQYRFSDRPDRRDLLEEVARAVVDELLGGSLPPPRQAMDALGPMVEQGRLVGWAAAAAEQALFEKVGLDGAWPDAAEGDVVAVAFNNSTGNKLDYFLRARAHYDVEVDVATSSANGTVLVELENRPPPSPQPDYVMENLVGLPRGHNRTWVSIYTRVPPTELSVDGASVTWDSETEAGFFVASTFVTMAPGDEPTIEVTLDGPVDLTDDGFRLTLWSPPTARMTPVTATVEVRHLDGTVSEVTTESRAGASSVVVPF